MKASEMLHILKIQNKRLFIVWLDDVDAKEDKLYCYWKHIVK